MSLVKEARTRRSRRRLLISRSLLRRKRMRVWMRRSTRVRVRLRGRRRRRRRRRRGQRRGGEGVIYDGVFMYVCKVNLKRVIKMAGIDAFPYHCHQRVYSMNEYLSLSLSRSAHMLLNPPYLLYSSITIDLNIIPYLPPPSTTLPKIPRIPPSSLIVIISGF